MTDEHPRRREDDRTIGELTRVLESLRGQISDGFANQREFTTQQINALREVVELGFRASEAEALRIDKDLQDHKRDYRGEMTDFKRETRDGIKDLDDRLDRVQARASDQFRNLAVGIFLAFVAAGFSVLGYYLTQGAS